MKGIHHMTKKKNTLHCTCFVFPCCVYITWIPLPVKQQFVLVPFQTIAA